MSLAKLVMRQSPERLHMAIDSVVNGIMQGAGASYSELSSTKGHMAENPCLL